MCSVNHNTHILLQVTAAPGACLGTAQVSNSWSGGAQMSVIIPITQAVDGWYGTISFSEPTTMLDVSSLELHQIWC